MTTPSISTNHLDGLLTEKWVCEKCRLSLFDTFEEAVLHEEQCDGDNILGSDFRMTQLSNKVTTAAEASFSCDPSHEPLTIVHPSDEKCTRAVTETLLIPSAHTSSLYDDSVALETPVSICTSSQDQSLSPINSKAYRENRKKLLDVDNISFTQEAVGISEEKTKLLRISKTYRSRTSKKQCQMTLKPTTSTRQKNNLRKEQNISKKNSMSTGSRPLASIFLSKEECESSRENRMRVSDLGTSKIITPVKIKLNHDKCNRKLENEIRPATLEKSKSTKKKHALESESLSNRVSLQNASKPLQLHQIPSPKRRKRVNTSLHSSSAPVNLVQDTYERINEKHLSQNDIDFSRTDSLSSSLLSTKQPFFNEVLSQTFFPVPSHVIPTEGDDEVVRIERKAWRSNTLKQRLWLSHVDCARLTYSFRSEDECIPKSRSTSNSLHESFSSIFLPRVVDPSLSSSESGKESMSWVEKHSIQNIPVDVCGEHNKVTAEKLMDFINEWKDHRREVINTRNEKMRKLAGYKRGKTLKTRHSRVLCDDDFMDSSDDESSSCCNVLVLTGPCGSGKTSLVHAAATQCQCVVLEINTTMKRSGQALKNAIEESTLSHSNLALLRGGIASENGHLLLDDCDDEDKHQENVSSLSVVLIDEVDLLFDEGGDNGFWQMFCSLAKRAKSPIILTSSSLPNSLLNSNSIRYVHLKTRSPTPIECASKICQIALMENVSWSRNIAESDVTKNQLINIAKLCSCDLRRIINEMQLFVLTHKTRPDPQSQNSYDEVRFPEIGDYSRVRYPSITSISPSFVSSIENTILTIKGNAFIPSKVELFSMEAYIGDQVSPKVVVVDDTTALVACPPSIIRDVFHSTLDKCYTCQFSPILIKLVNRKGCSLTSDASSCRLGEDGNYSSQPCVEYLFPDVDSSMEMRSRLKLDERRMKSRIVSDASNETFESQIPDEIDTKINRELLPYASLTTTNLCDSTIDSRVVSCTPSTQFTDATSDDFDFLVDDALKMSEWDSDIAFLTDALDYIGLPMLSGAVYADSEGVDCASLSQKGTKLTPFAQRLVDCSDESVIFHGASETYMSRPTAQRDRCVLASSLRSSRGKSVFRSEISHVTLHVSSESEHDHLLLDSFKSEVTATSDEDAFLPWNIPPSLRMLPNLLAALLRRDRHFYDRSQSLGNSCIMNKLDFDRRQRLQEYIELVEPMLDETLRFGEASHPMMYLDYIPSLRNMAHSERSTSNVLASLEPSEEKGESRSLLSQCRATRRNTRLMTSVRKHHFESLVRANSHMISGKAIGEKLADKRLKIC